MASRLSTPSEGEIVESGSEKANPSQPSVNGTSVDRESRKRSMPASRSPSPDRRRRDSYRSHSRSRSPFRLEQRGGKRGREEDHYDRGDRRDRDPRSFKVHYEGTSGGKRERRERERGGNSIANQRYDERHSGRPRENRMRTVSRSPPRFSDRKDRGSRPAGRHGSKYESGPRGDGGRYSREQSVSEDRGKPSSATAHSSAETEHTKSQTQNARNGNGQVGSDNVQQAAQEVASEEPLDEAALIEQRRKRREAIKAKHRSQATPLLVQALNLSNNSTPGTSQNGALEQNAQSPDASKLSPPASPQDGSRDGSLSAFEISTDADLANSVAQIRRGAQEDGPSAADYDPTMDMQEDKIREVSRQQGAEVSSSSYDETKNNVQDVLIPEAMVAKPAPKFAKDEFDMFADDDMFAESSPKGGSKDDDMAIAIPVPRAKALDMSMLDDWDDEEGYYKIILGELLDNRYHVQLNLGKGMFSAVVRAMDQVSNKLVAIKIIRSNETMRKAAIKEIEILGVLNEADPEDKKHVIRLERYFEHKGHLCMVFEHLSINLREVLKKFGRDVGINLRAVRAYAQQMFLGLSLLHKCNILHADIKPDNVLVNESRNMLKICDLGSASDASENEITPYLVSRFYRAPEIILGMPYDFAIDTWSIGCTLYELYTGKILFTGRTNNQMLRAIMECRGKFSHKVLRRSEFAHLHFDEMLNFRSVERDRLSGKDTVRIMTFTKPTRDLRTRLMVTTGGKGLADVDAKEVNLFVDLLEKCLTLNPEKRCTPAEALKHPFILRRL